MEALRCLTCKPRHEILQEGGEKMHILNFVVCIGGLLLINSLYGFGAVLVAVGMAVWVAYYVTS